jgi:hypothetical protein
MSTTESTEHTEKKKDFEMLNLKSSAFYDHLKEAIAINSERMSLYAQMSADRSLRISRALIWLEKAALPIAWWIDRRAAKFQQRGIPVVANDFVPMHPLPPFDQAPLYRRLASKALVRQICRDLKKYKREVNAHVRKGRFVEAANISYDALQKLRQIEKEHQCHLAMTRHLIESIGFAALHAPQYAEAASLSRTLIWVQMWGLGSGLWLDTWAQPLHQMGVGILVNDLPLIPFESQFYEENKRFLLSSNRSK